MKYKIAYIIGFTAIFLSSATSCEKEQLSLEDEHGETHTCKLVFSATLCDFENKVHTRSGSSELWEDEACVYLSFPSPGGRINGKAVYDQTEDEWTLYYEGNLPDHTGSDCLATYFEGTPSATGNRLALSPNTAVYRDQQARYSKSGDIVMVQTILTPPAGRIRFTGTTGQTFNVSGFNTYTSYDLSTGALSHETADITLSVGNNGYTEYTYGFWNSGIHTLTIFYDDIRYSKACQQAVLEAGRSGFMEIPSPNRHEGWEMSQVSLPSLSTVNVTGVEDLYATVEATVISTGNDDLTDAGFVYSSSNPLPDLAEQRISCGSSTTLKQTLEGLQAETNYYIRAYAINRKGISYSEVTRFTTTKDLTVWDGKSVATSFGGGTGSAEDPILISTAAQFKLLADNVNNEVSNYRNIHFRLTRDLDLNHYEWTPIGRYWVSYGHDYYNPFSGVFDGNGHAIRNLHINITDSNDDFCRSAGLFGCIRYATIRNLAVDGNITGYFNDYTGGIIGTADYVNSSSEIENCVNYCTMNKGGGIGGEMPYGKLTNCVNYGTGAKAGLCYMAKTGSKLYCNHSFWLYDVATNSGNQYNGPTRDFSNGEDNASFSRNASACPIAPSYTDDLVEELNAWVYMHDGEVHYNSWKYEIVDGYARPAMIPE